MMTTVVVFKKFQPFMALCGVVLLVCSFTLAGAQDKSPATPSTRPSLCTRTSTGHGPVSRAEMAVMMVETFDIDSRKPPQSSTTEPAFTDVPETHWAAKAIQVMARQGLMRGYRPGLFYPQQKITRAEGFAIIGQSYGVFQFTPQYVEQVLSAYADSDKLPAWSRKAVVTAIMADLVNVTKTRHPDGTTTLYLNPEQPLTCTELHEVLARYHEQINPE